MPGSRLITPGSQPAFAPGEATRRYLQAPAARDRVDVDRRAAPPTYKRYRPDGSCRRGGNRRHRATCSA